MPDGENDGTRDFLPSPNRSSAGYHHTHMTLFRLFALAAALLAGTSTAQAQLRLPSLPTLPSLPSLPQATRALQRDVAPVVEQVRQRSQRVAEMLRERRELVEADPAGEPMVRGELVLSSPSAALLAAARAEGFTVVRERRLEALDLLFVTLHAPAGWDTPRALQRLRTLDPEAAIDFNHLYLESGEVAPVPTTAAPPAVPTPRAAAPSPGPIKIGL